MTRFDKDNVICSIPTDDPAVTGRWLLAEKRMLWEKNLLTSDQLKAVYLRAAEARFLGKSR